MKILRDIIKSRRNIKLPSPSGEERFINANDLIPTLPKGIKAKLTTATGRQFEFKIKKQGLEDEGRIYMRHLHHLDSYQFGNISLPEELQRKGIITAFHKKIEEVTRKPIVPDWTLSKAEYSRWKKIHPKSIENYVPMDKDEEMWTGNINPDNEYLKLRREQLK